MILLDTHILVWVDQRNERIDESVVKQLDSALADDLLAISAISFWELAMLQRKKRIQLPPLKRCLPPWPGRPAHRRHRNPA